MTRSDFRKDRKVPSSIFNLRSSRLGLGSSILNRRSSILYLRSLAVLTIGLALATGCRKEDMSDQPKFYKPYHETSLFADGTTARPITQHTIARGHLELEKDLFTG